MWPNPQFPTDLVTFIEEIHDEKLSSMKLHDFRTILTLPVPIPYEDNKLSQIFILTFLCRVSKGFMKT